MRTETVQRKRVKDILFKVVAIIIITYFTGVKDDVIIALILILSYIVYAVVWRNIKWGTITHSDCGCIVGEPPVIRRAEDMDKNDYYFYVK